MSIVDNERPPYVEFSYRPVEDRIASLEAGHYVTRDVAFVRVTRPGSRDNLDKEAEIWLREMHERARAELIPPSWPENFQLMYERWKKNEELPENGTPIKGWPVLSPAQQENVIHAGFRTVEDLAAASESEVNKVGIGALLFKQKARAWLDSAKNVGTISERLVALEQQVQAQTETIQKLTEQNNLLRTQIPKEPEKK